MRGKDKWIAGLTASFFLLSALTGPALAQQKSEPKAEPKPKVERKAEPKTGKEKFGKGEIKIAEDLAQKSGKTTDEILEMRKTGKGWGQIAPGARRKDGAPRQG